MTEMDDEEYSKEIERIHLRINDVWESLYKFEYERLKKLEELYAVLTSQKFQDIGKDIKNIKEKVSKWKDL